MINTSIYNGEGLRVEKQDSAGTTKFIWDFQNYLAELDETDTTKILYVQSPGQYGQLIAQYTGIPLPDYYFYDALGSVATTARFAGSSISSFFLYRAFGETTQLGGILQPSFAWVGQLGYYYDRDLLEYYLRARDYSPALARFLSRDPIGFDGGDVNLFGYARNSPIRLTDPSGLLQNPFQLPTPQGPPTGNCGVKIGPLTIPYISFPIPNVGCYNVEIKLSNCAAIGNPVLISIGPGGCAGLEVVIQQSVINQLNKVSAFCTASRDCKKNECCFDVVKYSSKTLALAPIAIPISSPPKTPYRCLVVFVLRCNLDTSFRVGICT